MKVKKKDLRKRLAQLPINYPDPEVLPDALPGGVLDVDREMVQVELLCKRLAHNEVAVRDAVLAEVPRYLERVTAPVAEMEASYADEIAAVDAYTAARPGAGSPYHYHDLPRALKLYREKAQEHERARRRREALRDLRRRRAEERRAAAQRGRFGDALSAADDGAASSEEDGDDDKDGGFDPERLSERARRYMAWMNAWCDLELVLLKLSRGLFYCLWHSDKPLVQLECAQRIADLLAYPRTDRCRTLFYGSLLRVLAREWKTIDKYRVDKFMALVRKMLFRWISWAKELETEAANANNKAAAAAAAAATATAAATTAKGKKRTRAAAEAPSPTVAAAATAAAAATPSPVTAATEGDVGDDAADGVTGGAYGLVAASAREYAPALVDRLYPTAPALRSVLKDMFFVLEAHIVPNATSTGLVMHICDVAFDEICRGFLSVPLFVCISAGVPLYAMSQGNFVEKRVLDNFFPPIAGGVLLSRRAAQLTPKVAAVLRARNGGKKPDAAAVEAEAQALAAADTDAILRRVARVCQGYALCPGTARAVRVMLNEAELVLRQTADPDTHRELTRTAQRRRLEREVAEVDDTRRAVHEERTKAKAVKKEDRRAATLAKIAERKASAKKLAASAKGAKKARKADADGGKGKSKSKADDEAGAAAAAVLEKSDKELLREAMREEKAKRLGKKAAATRDSKRKKDYKLTREELYKDETDSEAD